MNISPVSELSSDLVQLVPLTAEHTQAFYQAGKDDSLWRLVTPHQCRDLDTATAWVNDSLTKAKIGEHIVFVIIDRQSGKIVGSTRYCSIDRENKGIEIGFTFIAPEFQRSHINTHAKYLMLGHAFEQFGAIRVQFRTHENNQKSRNAIARLGATFEGIMRNQRILPDGSIRNTAQFCVTDFDWPQVKKQLLAKIEGAATREKAPLALCDIAKKMVEHAPLAQLSIACGDNQLAQTIYLPLWYDSKRNKLTGHLSAHNKLNWLLENGPGVNLVFQGEDAYVSPTWHEEQVVPTWNYQRLHLSGAFRFIADGNSAEKLSMLDGQVSHYEQGQWQLAKQPQALLTKMSEHIRCFEIEIAEQQLVEKVSARKGQSVRDAIAAQLQRQGLHRLAQRHQ